MREGRFGGVDTMGYVPFVLFLRRGKGDERRRGERRMMCS
jgi:hypothetical protein